MTERLLIIGATSAIAHAVARRYAERKARLYLVARREKGLEANAADLRVRGAQQVETAQLDANDTLRHSEVLTAAFRAFDGFDAVLVAHGTLPEQPECERSVDAMLASFDTNARSVIALLTDIANRFESQGTGAIGIISSPAGARGRASNYVYGAAKAAVTNFASGLRHRLSRRGVRVITILPGFVDTPMTASFKKGGLWAKPESVAADIDRALQRSAGVLYTPWFWRWIMLLIVHIPERLFLRTKL